jgi:hypothetical protein
MRSILLLSFLLIAITSFGQSPCNEPKITVTGVYTERLDWIRYQPTYNVLAEPNPDCKTAQTYRVGEAKVSLSRNGKLLASEMIYNGSSVNVSSSFGRQYMDGDKITFEIVKLESTLADGRVRTIYKNKVLSYTIKTP